MKKQLNMKKKKLILSLIKDNLIHTHLLNGLNKLGFDTGHYYLHLNETITKLLDVHISDNKCKNYLNLFNQVGDIDIIEQPEKLNKMTEVIYKQIRKKYRKI